MLLGYGVDLVVHKLSEGLTKLGHEVTVCCNRSDETFRKAAYRMREIRYRRMLTPSSAERSAFEVTEPALVDQEILIPCTFPYYYTAFRSGKPWIPVDFGVVPPHFYGGRIRRELRYHWRTQYGRYFRKAPRIVCISEYLKKNLPSDIAVNAEVLHPGVDHYPDTFLCNLKRLYELEGKVLLYLGRSMDVSPYKNTDGLLRVFSALKEDCQDLHLLMASNCTLEEQRRLERGGAIVLNGVLMHFVPSVYASADIYLTAALWEGFDLPLIEASYFGLPVVANAIGAHREIVRDGVTGFLASDEQELIEHVRRLLKDTELANALGREGKAFARKSFRWEERIASFEKILERTR